MKRIPFLYLLLSFLLSSSVFGGQHASENRIQQKDLKYLGAFRLPEGTGGSDWGYSGNALTYSPGGDPSGPDDGFPGSFFATGNETQLFISEINIPVPKIPGKGSPKGLNTAKTLQPFTSVFNRFAEYMEQPRAGLCFLPGSGGKSKDKLYFLFGLHLQDTGFEPSHGWFDPDLSNPDMAGPWVFAGYTGYVTNDYICRIPDKWIRKHTPGMVLATGRGREGPWAGGGPALFAFQPRESKIELITPLLLYGEQVPGLPEISGQKSRQMKGYSDSDRFRGCAWLSKGTKSAVVFTCTRAMGKSWYGFADGTVWDYQCGQEGFPPCPQVPPFPYDNRGFWAEDFKPVLLFYDTNDLADVAQGRKKSWEPQPYLTIDLSPYLIDPGYTKEDLINYKRDFVGSACFDEVHSRLFIIEPLADDDGKSIIHVFRLK